jgi:hypothetical protein
LLLVDFLQPAFRAILKEQAAFGTALRVTDGYLMLEQGLLEGFSELVSDLV